MVNEFAISIKEPETVSWYLGNFSYKTTQMLREINFKLFRKLLRKGRLKSISIDIDSSVVNVEGHQEGAVKGYNPKKSGNRCYNLQLAFCDEIKAYLTDYVRSGDTYTTNGAAEMIKEIVAQLKDEGLEITFRMDSGYFDDAILEGEAYDYFFMDFAKGTEYRQQIKTFRLKYIFLGGKIIRTARSVVMKLSEKYPYQEMYEKSMS